jgi:transcriptional regulator with XRE-family HTH domain
MNVKRRRLSLDVSQETVALRSGLSLSDVGRVERGERDPGVVVLSKLAFGRGAAGAWREFLIRGFDFGLPDLLRLSPTASCAQARRCGAARRVNVDLAHGASARAASRRARAPRFRAGLRGSPRAVRAGHHRGARWTTPHPAPSGRAPAPKSSARARNLGAYCCKGWARSQARARGR